MRQIMSFALLCAVTAISNTVMADEDSYASVRDKIDMCVTCHGEKGQSKIPANPILAGQEFYYLYVQLKDFKSGLRENKTMQPIVESISKDDLQKIAQYFSEQKWPGNNNKASSEEVKNGKSVISSGECVACHLSGFKGNSRVPRLAGQHPEYLAKTMIDMKNGDRKNATAMGSLMKTFSEDEIKAVSAYLAAFKEED